MKTHLNPSKFIQSLRLLTPEEFKSFHKWLQSPWANSNGKLVELYQLLQRHHPNYHSRNLTKEKVFARLYPQKKYDDKWMRNIMAGMSKQVEKFLAHQHLEKNDLLAKELLAKEYIARHESNRYTKKIKEIIKELESKKIKETDDYLKLYMIHEELYNNSDSIQTYSDGHPTLKIADLYLDTFYSIIKWRHINEMVERRFIHPEEWNLSDKKELLISLTKGLHIPINLLYQERITMVADSNKYQYDSFKKKYFSAYDQLPMWDRKTMLFYLINMVIRMWLKGEQEVIYELLSLYKTGIEKKLLFHHGKLTKSTFANIVTTANSAGEFDYSKMFIEKYSTFLPPEVIEDARAWALAKWHYKQKMYDNSIDILAKHQFSDDFFILSGKFLLLQSYFDACLIDGSYYLFFHDYVEALKKYFKRNKTFAKERTTALINTVNYAFKICKLVNNNEHSIARLEAIELKLNDENKIQGKKWLLNKLEEIKKGLSH